MQASQVEHNLLFAVVISLFLQIVNLDMKFACARTKTAAIVTHALAPAANEPVIEALYFTVLCDGGNEKYCGKLLGQQP